MPNSAKLSDMLYIPEHWEGLISPLDGVMEKIGLSDISLQTVPAPLMPDTEPDPPQLSEEESEECMEWFGDENDDEAPPTASAPSVIVGTPQVPDTRTLTLQLDVLSEVALEIPGLDGVALVLSPQGFLAQLTTEGDAFSLGFVAGLGIRFDPSLLRPMKKITGEQGKVSFEADASRAYAQIDLAQVGLTLNHRGEIDLQAEAGISIAEPVMVGDTGVIIEGADIAFNLTGNGPRPAGTPEAWKGLMINSASLRIPEVFDGAITATGLGIGAGGVSGTIAVSPALSYDDGSFSGDLTGEVFGIAGGIDEVSLTFQQNIPAGGAIKAQMILPFFGAPDVPLGLDIGLTAQGGFTAAVTSPDGILNLTREGVAELALHSVGVCVDDGEATLVLSGEMTPLVGGLDWPAFDVKELAIDAGGNVHLDGGWLDLGKQYSVDFHGFNLEVTKLGFGKGDDGGNYIGFTGGLNLVDGLAAGASVDGLRVSFYDDGQEAAITLDGVGVEFEVPDVLRFKGAVSYKKLPGDVHQFEGAIDLDLMALDMKVGGTLVVGSSSGENYFAIHLDADLPSGIPLWATGLSLYGISGLFAHQMEPAKLPDEQWYEGWYKRPTEGVTDLAGKWAHAPGSLALGAGVTLGTSSDNGHAFAGRMLMAIVFPGPVLLIEGKANLLKERAKLDAEEPNFRALAVLDKRAGQFQFGLDAQYKHDSAGRLIDLRGSAEAFFDLNDAHSWHVYVGEKEPRDKRVRAEIFSLFESNAYLMLDADSLALGAWVGYDKSWKFGPLGVTVEAWMESNVAVSWKPAHFHGDLWLHGKAELSVWKFGLGLTVDARIAGDVFDPFHLLGDFSVGINLPWPLPDFDADITLEWGPQLQLPPVPLPLQDVAMEHLKTTDSWPLERGAHLAPDYNNGGFRKDPAEDPAVVALRPPPASAPVVPLDSKPHLTFGRSVHDDALVAGNPQPLVPAEEIIGDPVSEAGPIAMRYGLKGLALHRWQAASSSWELVAHKGSTGPDDDSQTVDALFGSWAPVPAMPDGGGQAVAQTKLWLWSINPFDYTRHSGQAWEEWFSERFDGYPCIPTPQADETCWNFEDMAPGTVLTSPWASPEGPGMNLSWDTDLGDEIVTLQQPADGLSHGLCLEQRFGEEGQGDAPLNALFIELERPADSLSVMLVHTNAVEVTAYDSQGSAYPLASSPLSPQCSLFKAAAADLVRIAIVDPRTQGHSRLCLVQVCAAQLPSEEQVLIAQEMAQHMSAEMSRWSDSGEVLLPHSDYRLKIVTTVDVRLEQALPGNAGPFEQTEFAYFKTQGAPGLTQLSAPEGVSSPDVISHPLEDLSLYVRQTVPATVPALGERPALPQPVYRAYDVGVEFNERYVDLMYRLGGRDLGLYLYDNNNQPARDAQGRLIVLQNRWGQAEDVVLSRTDEHWLTVIDGATCVVIDQQQMPLPSTLGSADVKSLQKDALYEARLIPLLLHEDWSTFAPTATADGPSGALGEWSIDDAGSQFGPSRWQIAEAGDPPSRTVVQTSGIRGGNGDSPEKPGSLLLRGEQSWGDMRLSVYVRATGVGALGVAFRHQGPGSYYRVSMDRQEGYRRLIKVEGGAATVLAEDRYTFISGNDYLWTVEAVGASLRFYQDGALIFDVEDTAFSTGRIGLYSWGSALPQFGDLRVDDFGAQAPVVYRFAFTTSSFAGFYHHLNSHPDRTWRTQLADASSANPKMAAALNQAVPFAEVSAEISHAEAQAYEALAAEALGSAARQGPAGTEITRVDDTHAARAFLVRSSEPIDWRRVSVALEGAQGQRQRPLPPKAVKICEVSRASSWDPAMAPDESVTVLLQEAADLSGRRVELRQMPGALRPPAHTPPLLRADFDPAMDESTGGVLWQGQFDDLSELTLCDDGGVDAQRSQWQALGGQLSHAFSPAWEALGDGLGGSGAEALLMDGPTLYAGGGFTGHLSQLSGAAWVPVDGGAGGPVHALASVKGYLVAGGAFTSLGGVAANHIAMRRRGRWMGLGSGVGHRRGPEGARISALTYDAGLLYAGGSFTLAGGLAANNIASWNGKAWASLGGGVDGAVLAMAADDRGLYVGGQMRSADGVPASHIAQWDGSRWRALGSGLNGPVSALAIGGDGLYAGGSFTLAGGTQVTNVARWDGRAWHALATGLDGQVTCLKVIDGQIFASGAFDGHLARWDDGAWTLLAPGTDGAIHAIEHTGGPLVLGGAFSTLAGAPAMGVGQVDLLGDASAPQRLALASELGEALSDDIEVRARWVAHGPALVGVVARAQGSDGYRLTLNAHSGKAQLSLHLGGAITTLWSGGASMNLEQGALLSLTVQGARLIGQLEGAQLFDISDTSLQGGTSGLICGARTQARCDLLRVIDRARRVGQFSITDQGETDAPSHWRQAGGMLTQTSPIDSGPAPDHVGTFATTGQRTWGDVRIVTQLRTGSPSPMGLVWRYVNEQNHYRLSLDGAQSHCRVDRVLDGDVSLLWQGGSVPTLGEAMEITLDAVGPRLMAYLDGALLFDLQDASHPTGRVGLFSSGNSDLACERLEVQNPPMRAYALTADRFMDGSTAGWSFVDQGAIDGPSQWEVMGGTLRQSSDIRSGDPSSGLGTVALTGDSAWGDVLITARVQISGQGASGLIFRYRGEDSYYRLSMNHAEGTARLEKMAAGLTVLWQGNIEQIQGDGRELVVCAVGGQLRGYLDGICLFGVEDDTLSSGQVGLYCAANPDAAFSEVAVYPASQAFRSWLLNETFDRPLPGHYQVVDEGDVASPSQWQVIDGELRQSAAISGGAADIEGLGTYMLLGDAAWGDARITTQLASDATSGAVGVMFRVSDDGGCYRFSLDAGLGIARLVKKVDGAFTVLWEGPRPMAAGQGYALTIDAVGDRLTVYVDGQRLCSVVDSALQAGSVALYCAASDGARFMEVTVAAPHWAPWYVFGREERLAAGTRVQIHGGSAAAAPALPAEAGLDHRFAASVLEAAKVSWQEQRAELRMVDADGTAGHSRVFWPEDAFAPLAGRVVRKADGTAFFVMTDAGQPEPELCEGDHRLTLTFRRDNRAQDASSTVLSQAGDTGDEKATMLIPWLQ